MEILIIDDDKLTLRTVQCGIENLGHKTHTVESSEDAITMIVDGNYDLLIIDVMMPGISGLSLVTALRSVYHCNIPIIMMSTLSDEPLLSAAFDAGANDFIVKPFTSQELADKFKKYDKSISIT